MKKELNKKQIKKTCLRPYLYQKYFLSNSFIKTSEEFKSKVCISSVLWQKK